MYQHVGNRLRVMTRGVLVGLIHSKTLGCSNESLYEGKVVTLMSNDVDNLVDTAEMFHETWAQLLEVLIGILLLAREVGWLWPLPLVFIFCKSSLCLMENVF
jgi:ATP-binding cassette subfamily C (CFTR/MRP) protein 1